HNKPATAARPAHAHTAQQPLPPAPPVAAMPTQDQDSAWQDASGRQNYDELVRLRPRVTQSSEQDGYGYPYSGQTSQRSSGWATRPYVQFAPLFELLAYVALLGVG